MVSRLPRSGDCAADYGRDGASCPGGRLTFLLDLKLLGSLASRLGSTTLRCERLGLVARPDHVLDVGRMRIPVEQKPSAQRVWPLHTLQISAQCALLEEVSGVRPSYAVLVLANGLQQQVPFHA